MDHLADRLIALVSVEHQLVGLCVLAASALIEYVFPPFPGDTITLFGAFLITARGWSFAGVFAATLAGSAAGGMLDFYLGRWLHRRQARRQRQPGRVRRRIEALVEKFRRHGELYLIINRFLPGVRSLFFVAAGLAEMRAARVLVWTVVSAALWNLLVIGAGSLLGANLDELTRVFTTYSWFAWGLVAAVPAFWLVRAVVRRVRGRGRPDSDADAADAGTTTDASADSPSTGDVDAGADAPAASDSARPDAD